MFAIRSSRSCILLTLTSLACGLSLRAQTISTLVSVAPCRIIDTRNAPGPFGGPGLTSNSTRDVPIPNSNCGIPNGAVAYSLNVTVIPHGPLSYLTLWPTGQPMPVASTLNSFDGAVVANAAVVPAGLGGSVTVFVTDNTELIIDINGYFASQVLPVVLPFPPIPTVVNQSTSIYQNTSIGTGTSSASGSQNTAMGTNALRDNNGTSFNTAIGAGALARHSTGNWNTAVGASALSNDAAGSSNSVLGYRGMESNTSGYGNSAIGYAALAANTTGQNNTAVGNNALSGNLAGNGNIAIGVDSGKNLTIGSDNNIDIGHSGISGDSGVIRIGSASQNSIYIPVVYSNTFSAPSDLAVFVSSSGKLGVHSSSRRYKEDIRDIGDISNDIFKLRPVQFRYKQATEDGTKPLQYGLIAEEVDSVYPQLVVHNKDGQIEGVQYQQLPAMLLNEIQKQQKAIARQGEAIQKLMLRIETLEAQSGGTPASDRLQE